MKKKRTCDERNIGVQVLAATTDQADHSLIGRMNIHPVAIVGNQCDRNSVEEFGWNGHSVSTFSVTAWQGVP